MELFDWRYYLDKYPDLRINGVHTESQAINHWNTYGKREGRRYDICIINSFPKKHFFLSVMAIFKNEAHILNEWLSTHINEGIEHFYLINNDSTDNFKDIISTYANFVTLINISGNAKQVTAYNSLKNKVLNETVWVAIIDLDEFIFSTKNGTKIVDYVKEYDSNNAEGIYLPWITYGSSNLKIQPENVKNNFIFRHSYNTAGCYTGGKCIVKTDSIAHNFNIHLTHIKNNSLYVNENGEFKSNEWFGECPDVYMSEDKIKLMKIRINHYQIQSEEYFMNIKATRGAADSSQNNNIRNKLYFDNYDKNEMLDDILKLKYN
jgi:hypothetical protein